MCDKDKTNIWTILFLEQHFPSQSIVITTSFFTIYKTDSNWEETVDRLPEFPQKPTVCSHVFNAQNCPETFLIFWGKFSTLNSFYVSNIKFYIFFLIKESSNYSLPLHPDSQSSFHLSVWIQNKCTHTKTKQSHWHHHRQHHFSQKKRWHGTSQVTFCLVIPNKPQIVRRWTRFTANFLPE